VLQEQPLDREASVGLASLEQGPEAALPLLQNLATRGDLAQAWLVAMELGSAFDPDRIPDKLAWQLAGAGAAAADAGDLPDRLDAAIGRRQGPLAAKALLRAAKRCMAAGRSAEAQAHLETAGALPNLAPEMRVQIDAIANPREPAAPRAARIADPAVAAPARPAAAAAAPAVADVAGGSVRVLACKLIRLAEDALHVEVGGGKTRRVEFNRLVGIAAGVVATAQGASILTDFVLSWGESGGSASALRIGGAQLGLASLFPGLPTKEAYSRFLSHVLARIVGQPLPSREALANGEYPRFPSVAALNAAFYGAERG
jgi:hypothetical protein